MQSGAAGIIGGYILQTDGLGKGLLLYPGSDHNGEVDLDRVMLPQEDIPIKHGQPQRVVNEISPA